MLRNDLRQWLDANASRLFDQDRISDLPEGWLDFTRIAHHHGGEDEGSEYWTVYEFRNQDGTIVKVRLNGWYQSYNGADFSGYEEVIAVQKTFTVYEKV